MIAEEKKKMRNVVDSKAQLKLLERELVIQQLKDCLLYTSDAADERSSVDLGGRRIIKKKKSSRTMGCHYNKNKTHTRYTKNKITLLSRV